jgi:outer membrane lipoprotein carrier protein
VFESRRDKGLLVLASWLLVVGSVGISATASADDLSSCAKGTAKTTALRIQARYEGIRDLNGRFEQTNESATFGGEPLMNPDPKTGRVTFAKPGKMLWVYETPEQSVVVSDGKTLWIHDVAAKSATRLSVTAGFLSGAALQFLLGDGKILESFAVEAVACERNRVCLDLFPKADSTYERLGLVANAESGDILETSVVDLFGNLTRIEFSEVQINQGPSPKLFVFEVPDGVDVIEYDGSPGS